MVYGTKTKVISSNLINHFVWFGINPHVAFAVVPFITGTGRKIRNSRRIRSLSKDFLRTPRLRAIFVISVTDLALKIQNGRHKTQHTRDKGWPFLRLFCRMRNRSLVSDCEFTRLVDRSVDLWVVNFCLYFCWPMHYLTWRREKCRRMVRQMWNTVKQWVMR